MVLYNEFLIFVFFVWCFALLLTLFKNGLPGIWKITALILFLFYIALYYPILLKFYKQSDFNDTQALFFRFLKVFINFIPMILFLVWPVTLWSSCYLHPKQAVNRIRILSLITLFYWLFWFAGSWFGLDWGNEIINLGKGIKIPTLPTPPVQ